MNLVCHLICPRNLLSSFMFVGVLSFLIASTFLGSTANPSLDTMCPSNTPLVSLCKGTFCRIELQLCLSALDQAKRKKLVQVIGLSSKDAEIIYKHPHKGCHKGCQIFIEYFLDHSLECCRCIFQAKHHHIGSEGSPFCEMKAVFSLSSSAILT